MNKIINSLLHRYRSVSVEVRAAFWYTICNVLLKAISLITVPIFTRILSEADYGVVGVYTGWRDIIFIFGTLNLFYSAYNTAIIKYKKDIDAFTSSMIGLIDFITFSLVIIYLCGRSYFEQLFEMPSKLMLIILAELLTVPAYNFWMTKERFKYNYRNVVLVTLGISICAPILSLVLVILSAENKAFYRILGITLPTILVGCVISIMFIFKGGKLFNREYWIYGLRFNLPLIPHYLSGTVLNQSDRIMISKLISVDKAGIYSVAYSAALTITIVTSAINQSLTPWLYKKLKESNYMSIKRRTNQILLVIASILALFILVVPEVVSILAPSSYQEAVGILPVLVMSVYFQFLYGFFGTVDFYFEKSLYPMLASVIAAVVNLITNYFFIPMWGYLAAGYTTLFSFIIMAIMHYFFMRFVLFKERIKDSVFDIKTIIMLSVLFSVVGFGESLLYVFPIIRYFIAITLLLILVYKRERIISIIKES